MNNNVILSQIPLEEFLNMVKQAVHQEMANSTGSEKKNICEPPVTTKQLCEYLNITEPTVIRWRQKGKIPFFQIGSAVRYDKNEVMEALRINKQKTR